MAVSITNVSSLDMSQTITSDIFIACGRMNEYASGRESD